MGKLHYLQALRGIAALMVVIDHTGSSLIKYGSVPRSLEPLFWQFGNVGVYTFFVISGFIMVYISEGTDTGLRTSSAFLLKRVARIMPAYWLATFITVAFFLFSHHALSLVSVFRSLFFIPYSDDADHWHPVLAQGWTLNYETMFYIIFSAVILYSLNKGIIVACTLMTLFVISKLTLNEQGMMGFYSSPIILYFVIGMIIAKMHYQMQTLFRLKWNMGAIGALLVAGVLSWFVGLAVLGAAVAAIGAVVVCTSTACDNPKAFVKVLERSGDASYSTYLFHTVILALLNRCLNPSHFCSEIVYIFVGVFGSFSVGYVVYIFFEKPSNTYLHRLITRYVLPARGLKS